MHCVAQAVEEALLVPGHLWVAVAMDGMPVQRNGLVVAVVARTLLLRQACRNRRCRAWESVAGTRVGVAGADDRAGDPW